MSDASKIDVAPTRAQKVVDKRERLILTSDEADRQLSDIINHMPGGSTKAILRRSVINQKWLR